MGAVLDLAGQRFGKIVVLHRVDDYVCGTSRQSRWQCKCDCGSMPIMIGTVLKNKSRQCSKCGNSVFKDLTGQKFGKLTVISRGPNYGSSARFRCKCDCGNETLTFSRALRNGNTTSCGCNHTLPKGDSAKNIVFSGYKEQAKRRGITFTLTLREVVSICELPCSYCGSNPSQKVVGVRTPCANGDFVHNGIDRVDNSKGYENGNVVSCCKTCNFMKSTLEKEAFLDHIKKILLFQGII